MKYGIIKTRYVGFHNQILSGKILKINFVRNVEWCKIIKNYFDHAHMRHIEFFQQQISIILSKCTIFYSGIENEKKLLMTHT